MRPAVTRPLRPAMLAAAMIATGLVAGVDRAAAQPAPLADPKIEKADQLFAEGKALLDSNLIQACAKFDESLRYNAAAIGTLVNVALCDEKLGRVASAVAKFTETRDRAKEQGLPQHLKLAEEHLAALGPSVPHLTIKLTEALPGTSIVLDDRVVPLDDIANIAVDPGERAVEVNAPARLPYRTKILIAKAEHKDLVVPALAKSVVVRSSRHRIGQVTTVVGAVAAATGLGLGLYARGLYKNQFPDMHEVGDGLCDKLTKQCEPHGQSQVDRARTFGNIGTIVGVAGVVTAGIGAYLWIRSPRTIEAPPPAALVGLAAVGRF
jgi:hypothetical protein